MKRPFRVVCRFLVCILVILGLLLGGCTTSATIPAPPAESPTCLVGEPIPQAATEAKPAPTPAPVETPMPEPAPEVKPDDTTPAPVATPTPDVDLKGEEFKIYLPIPELAAKIGGVELATAFPKVKETMAVYRAKPPTVTIDSVAELAREFGFEGDPVVGTDAIWISDKVEGLSRTLRVYINSGGIEYIVPRALYPKTSPTLPSDEEAKRIANEFLAQRGLLPPGWRLQG